MNRPVDHEKRARLLARIVDHALKSGVTTLALRPTAAAVGTSARMLVHHFGTRDALAAAVLLEIEGRLVGSIALGPEDDEAGEVLRRMWRATTTPELNPPVRAAFEIWGRALVRPGDFSDFLGRVFDPWRDGLAAALVRSGVPDDLALTRATLAVAAFNGLQLARLTNGDEARARAALEMLIATILPSGENR